MVSPQNLINITGISDIVKITSMTNEINDTLKKYDINTPLRIAHFLAQILHESGNFKFMKENLNYSSKGLLTTFPKYFPTEEVATLYARNPDKIANKVYANRMGNGSESSGDGAKFKGRGAIQITGCENYTNLSKDLNVDFIKNPELLETTKYAMLSAGWFWNKNKLNALADKDDVLSVTKRINGGTHGLDDRKAKLEKIKAILK